MKKILFQLPIFLAAATVIAQSSAPSAPDWFGGSQRGLPGGTNNPPPQAAPFLKFAPRVKVTWDDQYLYVQNNGLPDHGMMVGITAWQQQVPLPQPYFGENAWAIPLHPVPAKNPRPIKNDFLRGAIAVGADGIPIFNPQNNRGEISQQIGELDNWGGHCGRADDYHYHVAPLVLQSVVGKNLPIAYALDGYPIYGLTEPDGSAPADLDEFHGHTTAAFGYHYHASTNYPYL
jgi:YHYH protein